VVQGVCHWRWHAGSIWRNGEDAVDVETSDLEVRRCVRDWIQGLDLAPTQFLNWVIPAAARASPPAVKDGFPVRLCPAYRQA